MNNKNINCPFCNSKNIAKILFGLPAFTKELEEDLESEKVILGGCLMSVDSPQFHCNNCGKEWRSNNEEDISQ